MKKIFFIVLIFASSFVEGQSIDTNNTISAGIRLKKYTGFYWVNGVSGEFHSYKLLNNKLHLGLNIATSNLGTAFNSNALSTWETEISGIYYFRSSKKLNPIARVNVGIASVLLDNVYSSIPSRSFIASLETGLKYSINSFSIRLFGGYNFFSGNGITGLGTIYPIYGGIGIMKSFK
jgi:hypothetical protein